MSLASQAKSSELARTASAKQYMDFYTERVGLSENKLSVCVRIHQQRLNKIANRQVKNVDIPTLVAICLALRLNLDEAVDLMARFERAFSPANKTHYLYMNLIDIYSKKEIDYQDRSLKLDGVLLEADEFLMKMGGAPLPNTNK